MNTRYFKSVAPIALVVILFSVFPAIAAQNQPVSSHEGLAAKLDIASDFQRIEKEGQATENNPLSLTKAERQWLKAHPVITLGHGLRPPSVYIDDKGNKVGISVDYINLLGTMLGVEFKIAPGTWDSSLSKARKKEIDGILGIFRSPERETYLNFTEPYASSYIAIVMRNTSPKAASYRELAGKRVAAEKGDYIAGYLAANYPDIKLSSDFPDHQSALNSLVTGDVDAAVGALPVLSWYMDKMLISDISVTGLPPETHKAVRIGIRKDWPEFAAILDKAINSVSDFQFRKITRKYISVDIAPQPQKAALSDEEKAWLKAHPEIVLGTDRTWAPFVIPGTDGTVKGIEADLIERINRATGANIRLELGQWSELVENARTRKIDGLAVGTYHKERSGFLVYSDTAYTIHKSIFTKKKNAAKRGHHV